LDYHTSQAALNIHNLIEQLNEQPEPSKTFLRETRCRSTPLENGRAANGLKTSNNCTSNATTAESQTPKQFLTTSKRKLAVREAEREL